MQNSAEKEFLEEIFESEGLSEFNEDDLDVVNYFLSEEGYECN